MKQSYCIYTDEFYNSSAMSLEHIIPLSLGGCNELNIDVNSNINKILGSKIDGRLCNDYLISCLRRRKNLKGHNKTAPLTKFTNVKFKESNLPIQITHRANSKTVYDLRNRKYLTDEESKGRQLIFTIPFDKQIRALFVAKVALSAGYFIYGDTFVNETDHKSLREYMNFSIHRDENLILNSPLRFIDEFLEDCDERTSRMRDYFNLIFKTLNCTCVKFALCSEHFLVSVAIAGQYLATINFKANVKQFPNSGLYSGGHVITIQDGKLKRASLNHIEKIVKHQYSSMR